MSRKTSQRCLTLLLCALLLAGALLYLQRAALGGSDDAGPKLPRILHQVSESEMVFSDYSFAIESCKRLNPNWTYVLWRDTDAELLMKEHFPQFYHTQYTKYTDRLQKSDSIRYIILYLFGGVYADLDVECVRPFFPDLESEVCFLDQENRAQTQVLWDTEKSAMNSVMGCRPGHPFMLDLIRRMEQAVDNGDVMISTGPRMLTKALLEWTANGGQRQRANSVRLMDPDVFSPHVDNAEMILDICRKRFGRPLNNGDNWVDRACRDLQLAGLRDNFTDRTLAVHWFMHLGWFPKHMREERDRFHISRLMPNVRFYRQHRAQLLELVGVRPDR